MFYLLPLRPSILALNATKRIGTAPNVSRSLFLTRSFSKTPFVGATASKTATAKAPKSTKSTTAKKSSSGTKSTKSNPKKKEPTKKPTKKAAFTIKGLNIPPKPRMTPFVAFVNEKRTTIPKPTSLKDAQDQTTKLAVQWRALTDAEKQSYYAKAIEINKERAVIYDEWLKNVDARDLREINKRRKASGKRRIRPNQDAPRKPVSSFFRFLKDFKTEHPHLQVIEAAKEAATVWRSLPAIEKQKYNDIAKAEMKAYVLELKTPTESQQFV